jgi:F-type H+-transporting ATPase subunit delta
MDKKTQALVEQYAKSLVEIAIEKDSLAELQSETEALLSVFEETNLAKFLSSLVVSRDEKTKLVRLLQESSSVYMNNFLEVILQNEREAFLEAILKVVLEGFAIATNQHDIVVTTAVALTEEQKERVLALVADKFGVKAGKLVENIDSSILGGFIINVNNKVIDTSIRHQLQEFKMNLK